MFGIAVKQGERMLTIGASDVAIKQIIKSETGVVEIIQGSAGLIDYWYLETVSPVWAKMVLTFHKQINSFEFDYEFLSAAGAEGYLVIYLDGIKVGHIDERYKEVGRNRSPRFALGSIEPGDHTLAVRIDPYTETASSIKLSNLSFYLQSAVQLNTVDVLGVLSG